MKMLTRDNDSEPRKKNTEQKTTKNKTPDEKKGNELKRELEQFRCSNYSTRTVA